MTVMMTVYAAFGLTFSETKRRRLRACKTKCGVEMSLTVTAAGQVYEQTAGCVYLGKILIANQDISVEVKASTTEGMGVLREV